jgi:hypothetical protein
MPPRPQEPAKPVQPEDVCEPEWVDWQRLSPAERWIESSRLWSTYLALGGSLDPEPDTQSPFGDEGARGREPADGGAGLHSIRRSGV